MSKHKIFLQPDPNTTLPLSHFLKLNALLIY